MIGHLQGWSTQFPFQCTLTFIGVMAQDKFGYTEITPVYSGKHCGYWYTVGSWQCKLVAPLPSWFEYSFYGLDCH